MKKLVIMGLLGFLATYSYATGDTVHYRMLIGTLGDSSRIQYEIGSFGLKQSGNLRYLKFYSINENPYTYFRTESFVATGSNDSLGFFAFINYDNAGYDRGVDNFDTSSTEFKNWANGIVNRYQSLFITPDTNFFNYQSNILYVLELRKTSDNSIISRLDTTRCYLNVNNKLVYRNYPPSKSIRKRKINGVQSGDTVYLVVTIQKSLPNSGDFTGYDYLHVDGNNPATVDDGFIHLVYAPSNPPPLQKIVSKNGDISSFSINENPPLDGVLKCYFKSATSGIGEVNIYDESGKRVISQKESIVFGDNYLNVVLGSLPSGAYIASLSHDGALVTSAFTILR